MAAISSVLQCPCFIWEDHRGPGQLRGDVVELQSNDRWINGLSNESIRATLVVLALFSVPFNLFIRMPLRAVNILGGAFLKGQEQGEEQWQKICCVWQQLGASQANKPSELRHKTILAAAIATELAAEIVKVACIPLIAIAMTFAAFWGIVNPLDGRAMYGYLERLISARHLLSEHPDFLRFANFLAPCMQHHESWRKHNLFRLFPGYNPDDLPSRLLTLEHLLKKAESLGCDPNRVRQAIENWRGLLNDPNCPLNQVSGPMTAEAARAFEENYGVEGTKEKINDVKNAVEEIFRLKAVWIRAEMDNLSEEQKREARQALAAASLDLPRLLGIVTARLSPPAQ